MPGPVVRLRGLPYSTTADEIIKFLQGCDIDGGESGVHFTFSREGRPSGEAFVELSSEEDVANATAQNNEHIGSRYIEVFRVERSEMEWMIKRAGHGSSHGSSNADAVVKLRGLPFGCTKEEIAHFFSGLEIVPNGIMLPADEQGRNSGEAFVQFASPEIAERSFQKDKERIGHRYIELFKSDLSEANAVSRKMRGGGIRPLMGGPGMGPRPGPYDRQERFMGGMMGGPGGYGRGGRGGRNVKGFYEEDFDDGFYGGYGGRGNFGGGRRGGPPMGGPMRGGRGGMNMDRRGMQPGSCYMSKTGHSVHMRGLPFQALEQDVFDFFSPIQPVRCEFEYGDSGRATGEANVDFATHGEAVEAMKKHKSNMQHRYIELFLNSEAREPTMRNNGGGGGYGNGMDGGFGGGGMGNDNGYNDDMVSGFGQGGGAGFGGGYGGGQQSFGGGQGGGFGGGQSNFGSGGGGGGGGSGFGGGQGGGMGGNSGGGYNMGGGGGHGGGYGGGMSSGGGMMGNNYTAFG